MTKKNIFSLLVLISVPFILIKLRDIGYFEIPNIISPIYVFISIILLLSAMQLQGLLWYAILSTHHPEVSVLDCLTSNNLSIMMKYIPGKLFSIVGRASYMGIKNSISLIKTSVISTNVQIISIWTGLFFGFTGICILKEYMFLLILAFFIWFFLPLIIFYSYIQKKIITYFYKIFKIRINISIGSVREYVCYILLSFTEWFITIFAFYFLVKGISGFYVSFKVIFGYALALTSGIIAILSPGGLGVREGVLISYLVACGFPIHEATSISIISRFWYFICEVLIFLIGMIVKRLSSFKKLKKEKTK